VIRRIWSLGILMLAAACASAQTAGTFGPQVREFISEDAPVIALTHVRVIDGTGAAAREDQTVVLSGGKIAAIGEAAAVSVPDGAKVLDRAGYTVIPGLVGMHDHLFYTAEVHRDNPGALVTQVSFSFPRLYLALGVTTMRTTGSVEPYADLFLKAHIDAGLTVGPKINVTAPYLEGAGTQFAQMHELTGPDEARKFVDFWADEGAGSYKAYMHITRAELGAAIQEAHKRGLKLTGHLCSVTFREAVELGIDNLEHGFIVATDFTPDKKPDVCPAGGTQRYFLDVDAHSAAFQDLIHALISRHVAITSTLPVFELGAPGRPVPEQRMLDSMSSDARINYLTSRAISHSNPNNRSAEALKKEMELEHAFAAAGGTLMAGPDPTGMGGVLAGFGDQREVELLVEAGFTPSEAIHIATANGAEFLGLLDRVGTLAPGKAADIMLIHGDPSKNIADIEKVETVFKDGVGYDSAKLIESVRGQVGIR
jgi:imidazolonepropionase-like amidohydrolase